MTDSNLTARIGSGYYQQIGEGKQVGNDKIWTIKINNDASITDTNHRGKYALIKHSGGDTYITYGTKDEITGAINNSTQPQQLKTRYFDANNPSSTKVDNGGGEKLAPTEDNVNKAWTFANSSDATVKQTWDYYASQINTDAGSSGNPLTNEQDPPTIDVANSTKGDQVPLDGEITAKISDASNLADIDQTTLNNFVKLYDSNDAVVPGTPTYDKAQKKIVFKPSNPLTAGEAYKLKIDDNIVKDEHDNKLTGAPDITFTAKAASPTNEQDPPTIDVANSTKGDQVPLDGEITAKISDASNLADIDQTTLNNFVKLYDSNDAVVPGTPTYDKAQKKIVFKPSNPLTAGEAYKLKIDDNIVKDEHDNKLTGAPDITFTAKAAGGGADTTAPVLQNFDPNATPPQKTFDPANLFFQFDDQIKEAGLIIKDNTGTDITSQFTITVEGNKVKVAGPFKDNEKYKFTFGSGLTNVDGKSSTAGIIRTLTSQIPEEDLSTP